MAAKYEPQENEMPEQVNEPIAAYQRTASDMSLYIPTKERLSCVRKRIMKKVGCILKKRSISR